MKHESIKIAFNGKIEFLYRQQTHPKSQRFDEFQRKPLDQLSFHIVESITNYIP